ncbi:hypothetical protein SKAU_G00417480 [Synaphobranchus kaupii]|uniref:C2H2-type domain-containing protein n=1 Tax=Synaphobranchus kaupii TaxID=118154 RepID=A0A9Q1IAT3_SYNKA|nr:hypothetical protein SKAU_G00417480 [Synaphobranchus kaupii]
MDPDIIKMQEEETTVPPTELAPEGPAEPEPYTTIIIQEPPATSIVQPYQHENLQCFQCFITFCNSKAKERHMKKSHREEYKQQLQQCDTLFTCYVCDRTFPSSEELTQHQASHNKEDKPFKCPHCQESFRTFSELTSHRRQVCPERQFVCRDCGETFRGAALLRSHRLVQHPPRPEPEQEGGDDAAKTHRCGKCGKGFEAEAELLQHQENHAGDRHCNEKFKAKRGRPAKTAQEPPSDASQDQQAGEERKLKAAGAPARQHPCPDCELSFPAAAQLRAHKKEKHSRPPPPPPPRKAHPCGECEESFARPEQLEAHMARAHCAGRHSCPTCGKSFGRESNLKAHRQTHVEEAEAAEGGTR